MIFFKRNSQFCKILPVYIISHTDIASQVQKKTICYIQGMETKYQDSGYGIKSGYVFKIKVRMLELNLNNIVEVNFANLSNF